MKVCDEVAHLLIRQRLAGPNLLPIRIANVMASSNDDGSQTLIAHERQVAGVDDFLFLLLMAGDTVSLEDAAALFSRADRVGRIRRHVSHFVIRASPSRTHASNQRVHLMRREKASCGLAEGR